ncbi:hypothetical protein LR48_Vigan10g223100 [Vigna angularis]|uniref:Uncharacterized protein n=1 Tax=Phaseolus angularis TaxID=3914 RepID=A0A0L9VNL4_PHAAN|nr:hypothetical protein LR48_Vigan10g223100 [Vigna angularis]
MKEEERTWFEAYGEEDEYGCYEKRYGDCPYTIRVCKLGLNEGFMMVAQRRRCHGVQRVSRKTKLAIALRFAGWVSSLERDLGLLHWVLSRFAVGGGGGQEGGQGRKLSISEFQFLNVHMA